MSGGRKICVGQFAGAHGVRGVVKLRSFTAEPEDFFDYAPLYDEKGNALKIILKSSAKEYFLVDVAGVTTKEQADDLRGDRIYIPRDVLPPPAKGEYYDADLIGLETVDKEGKSYGKVMAVHDYGAGTFLEIGTNKKDSFMLPFKDAFVPEVDIDAGQATIVIPEGWLSSGVDENDKDR